MTIEDWIAQHILVGLVLRFRIRASIDWLSNRLFSIGIIEPTASTTSLVAQLILHEEHKAGTIPEALADLLFTAISNDTKGLKKKKTTKQDADSAERIFPYTSYHKDDMKKTAKQLAQAMKSAEEDVHHLNVTQLYA